MEPKFQTSFIPKKPILNQGGMGSGVVRETNVVSIVASIFFIASMLTAGGLYAYKYVLLKQIDESINSINTESAAFQMDKIKELINSNNRILSSKGLLDKHVTVSKLLYLIQDLTVKKMRILSLSYTNQGGTPAVSLVGDLQTYNALAEQARIFGESDYLKNSQFSNFTLQDNGYIKVDFSSTVDTNLISYKKAIGETESIPVIQ